MTYERTLGRRPRPIRRILCVAAVTFVLLTAFAGPALADPVLAEALGKEVLQDSKSLTVPLAWNGTSDDGNPTGLFGSLRETGVLGIGGYCQGEALFGAAYEHSLVKAQTAEAGNTSAFVRCGGSVSPSKMTLDVQVVDFGAAAAAPAESVSLTRSWVIDQDDSHLSGHVDVEQVVEALDDPRRLGVGDKVMWFLRATVELGGTGSELAACAVGEATIGLPIDLNPSSCMFSGPAETAMATRESLIR